MPTSQHKETHTMPKEDFMVDCVIMAGELDPNWYGHYLKNDLFVTEVAKHNVPYSKFLEWSGSCECIKRKRELEEIGRKRFGEDYWMKYSVCHFCTSPHKD